MTPVPARPDALWTRVRADIVMYATMLAAIVAIVLFAAGSVRGVMAPGSTLGIGFGIAAAASLVAVMLYSARRALPAVRSLGPTYGYMQVHLWFGALFVLLFLLHTDFRMPVGGMAVLLWLLSMWVAVTGALGLALQRVVPHILEPASTFEVHLQRIPELVGQLRQRAESAAMRAEPRVRTYYEQELAPDMAAPRMIAAALLRNPRTRRRGTRHVELLKQTLPPDGIATLDELSEVHATKHEMDVHYTLQRVLRGWLYLHLPVAIALLVLVALHVFFMLYF